MILFCTHFLGCCLLYLGRHNVLNENVPIGWMTGEFCHRHRRQYHSTASIPASLLATHDVARVDTISGGCNHRWVGEFGQDTDNQTKDFVSCTGGTFDAGSWNSVHGTSCKYNAYGCAPVPEDFPYDVDCSWIRDRMVPGVRHNSTISSSSASASLVPLFFPLQQP